MTLPFVLLGVVLILALVAAILMQLKGKGAVDTGVYVSRKVLLTPAEVNFYHSLKNSIPAENYRIYAKVRMADIVDVRKGLDRGQRSSAFNRIVSKHVDFLLCNPKTSAIYAVVELDDSSHQKAAQMEKDQFKDETFAACNIPLMRFPAKKAYDISEIRKKINTAFGR